MPITLKNIPAVDVPTPDPTKTTLFTDTNDLLYRKDDAGVVTLVGGAAATVDEVVIGTGTGITSSANLKFDILTSTLSFGPAATPGIIKSALGSPITLQSDDGNYSISLSEFGEIYINGFLGELGSIITSQGPGFPTSWTWDGPTFRTFLFSDSVNHDMDGVENSTWTTVPVQGQATFCSVSGQQILFNFTGTYEIEFYCTATCSSGNWPDTATACGITFGGSTGMTPNNGSTVGFVYRYSASGDNAALDAMVGGGIQVTTWTSRVYAVVNAGSLMNLNMRVANPADPLQTYQGNIIARISKVDNNAPS